MNKSPPTLPLKPFFDLETLEKLGIDPNQAAPVSNVSDNAHPNTDNKEKNNFQRSNVSLKHPPQETQNAEIINQKQALVKKNKELLELLCKRFSRVFNLQIPQPLKINIVEDLCIQLKDEYTNEQIRKALGYYTHNVRYQRALLAHKHRYDLEGKVNGEVTPEHKERAKTQLSKLKNSYKPKNQMSFSKNKEVFNGKKF